MSVVVTGGAGFLGRRVAGRLAQDGGQVVALDLANASPLPSGVAFEAGEISDAALLERVITRETTGVVHLAAVVSGAAEADFDLGVDVNLKGTMAVLERCRAVFAQTGRPIKVLFASSVAVYGGSNMPAVITDRTILTPQSSYGAQKAIVELLLGDYSRKGFVDGRTVRLPTIVVRPGKPNLAASSFASGIIREPLQGIEAECPVDPSLGMWLLSPRRAVDALVRAFTLDPADWGDLRTVALPGLTVTIQEMLTALSDIAGPTVAARVSMRPDQAVQAIVGSWPMRFSPQRGLAMGFTADANAHEIIQSFIEDELEGAIVA